MEVGRALWDAGKRRTLRQAPSDAKSRRGVNMKACARRPQAQAPRVRAGRGRGRGRMARGRWSGRRFVEDVDRRAAASPGTVGARLRKSRREGRARLDGRRACWTGSRNAFGERGSRRCCPETRPERQRPGREKRVEPELHVCLGLRFIRLRQATTRLTGEISFLKSFVDSGDKHSFNRESTNMMKGPPSSTTSSSYSEPVEQSWQPWQTE